MLFIHFNIYNTKHNPLKRYKCVMENSVFLLICGFKMRFMVLDIWLLAFGKIWKVLEIFLKEFS